MSKSCPQSPLRRHQGERGFSLVEVLVSIVVLSFGMLGMVGLQAAALQANRDAKFQSTAVNFARELAEMMRGNKEVSVLTAGNPYVGNFAAPLAPNVASYCLNIASAATGCADTTAVANAQMTEWLARVDAELPGAKVVVCFDATPYDANGLPQWTCSSSGTIAVVKIGWTRASLNRAASGSAAFERATIPSVISPVTPGSTM